MGFCQKALRVAFVHTFHLLQIIISAKNNFDASLAVLLLKMKTGLVESW